MADSKILNKLNCSLLRRRVTNFGKMLSTLVELGQRLQFLAENPHSEVPDTVPNLIGSMLPRRHGENLIQFLQCESWTKEMISHPSKLIEALETHLLFPGQKVERGTSR